MPGCVPLQSRNTTSKPIQAGVSSIRIDDDAKVDDQICVSNNSNSKNIRRNPAILLALDSLHRSLLQKNLQFDQDSANCYHQVKRRPEQPSKESGVKLSDEQRYSEVTPVMNAVTSRSQKASIVEGEDVPDFSGRCCTRPVGMTNVESEVHEPEIVKKEVTRNEMIASPRRLDSTYQDGSSELLYSTAIEQSTNVGQNCIDDPLVRSSAITTTSAVNGEACGRRAPLGCMDTDDEVDSLQRYDDKSLEELVNSLHEPIALSELETIDTESEAFVTGYDTIDFATGSSTGGRNWRKRKQSNDIKTVMGNGSERLDTTIETDNISELQLMMSDSAHDYSASNASPANSSPVSSGSSGKIGSRLNGSEIYRSLKDRLRSSIRKSKNLLKNEHQKLVHLFESKTGKRDEEATGSSGGLRQGNAFDLEEYRRKYAEQEETEQMYRSLSRTGSMVELSNQLLAELVNQIRTQCDIRKQLKQALAVCRSTREFECSPELIEAERLMLVSTLKETAARNELSRIDYGTAGKVLTDRQRVGVVALNHFEFPLKEQAVNDAIFNYFYVVVCTYKNQVRATLAKERFEDRVRFGNCEIRFENLDPEYEIRVEVFVLRLRKNARIDSLDGKHYLKKDGKRNPADEPQYPTHGVLQNAAKLLTQTRPGSTKNFDFDNEFSRFKSQGYIKLTSFSLMPGNHSNSHPEETNEEDLHHRRHPSSASSNFQRMVRKRGDQHVYLIEDFKYLRLDSMTYSSNLAGNIGMSLKSEVAFVSAEHVGFLNVGEEHKDGSIVWSRKWCKLNGFVLDFWNYPQECQEKAATLQIDLTKSINDEIELAERSVCSRPRTFRVDILTKASSSCSSSGISSYKDSDSHQTQSSAHPAPSSSPTVGMINPCRNSGASYNTKHFLLSVDTHGELTLWLKELNRIVKFLREYKI